MLQQNLELYKKIYDMFDEGSIITDKKGAIITVNRAFTETTGYSFDEVRGKNPNILNSGKHDPAFYIDMWAQIHADGYWEGEIWNRRKNGEIYPEWLKISSVKNNQGEVTHYIGVFSDITTRKKDAENLRLFARVFDSSSEGIMITDTGGNIISVNPAFTSTTGYTKKEIIGKKPNILQSGRQSPEFYIDMWTSIHATGSWEGEIWNRRKDGEVYPEWLSINAVKNEQGQITNYVGVFTDITERKRAEEHLKYLAHYDTLTGLPNRLHFHEKLSEAITAAEQSDQFFIVAVIFLDLDRFKLINDTLGHSVGDRVLKQVAQRLQGCVDGNDLIARLAGDEFTIMLTDIKHRFEVVEVLEKMTKRISEPFILQGQEYFISLSMGISLYPDHGISPEELIKNADSAMYLAKESGNEYKFYSEEIDLANERIVTLKNGLHRAIEQGQLRIYYQPQVDVESKRIVGLEALIRWAHPELGMISPADFIPIAEESGLIIPIGEWMLKEVCRQYGIWKEQGIAPQTVSINLSVRQFRDPDLVQKIKNTLRKTEMDPSCLELEITESISMHNMEEIIGALNAIRELNIKVSVDDFGTGHSSLSYLMQLPVDTLKIDKSFIKNLPSSDNVSIVRAIIDMAHALELKVTAEGVENEEELQFLKEHSCDKVQGYLFSRPVEGSEIEKMLAVQST